MRRNNTGTPNYRPSPLCRLGIQPTGAWRWSIIRAHHPLYRRLADGGSIAGLIDHGLDGCSGQ